MVLRRCVPWQPGWPMRTPHPIAASVCLGGGRARDAAAEDKKVDHESTVCVESPYCSCRQAVAYSRRRRRARLAHRSAMLPIEK